MARLTLDFALSPKPAKAWGIFFRCDKRVDLNALQSSTAPKWRTILFFPIEGLLR